MLFNSYAFIFFYLPIVFSGYFWISRSSHNLAALWLALASLFFYGWWNPDFVSLLLASILFNYGAGYAIGRASRVNYKNWVLIFAITSNLIVLAIFKYANFFIHSANSVGAQFNPLNIILPLGVSFFTFTQLAFLVDVRRGVAREYSFIHYLLFITWFPHLIAGPVLHHKQMMPQFALPETYRPNAESIAIGFSLFSLGLFKKVVLADQFSLYANPVFDVAQHGAPLMLFESWLGALAYTLQLYFDFSGYSDMAIGLSRLFNVKLPLNFNSPYKASSIIDFWRRWHMTLSAFLRDYLYIPLGGNRKGPFRRYVSLMATMLLGGLWHGAGWNFVIWGGLHGVYLVINHGWRKITGGDARHSKRWGWFLGMLLTFFAVVIAWVPFRATSLKASLAMLQGMSGMNGVSFPVQLKPWIGEYFGNAIAFAGIAPETGLGGKETIAWLLLGISICWFLPNSQQWLANFAPAWNSVTSRSALAWRPTRRNAIFIGFLLGISLLMLTRASEFLYFQF